MAISKETYKKAYSLINKSDRILLCVNNRSTFDTHLSAAALFLYIKDQGKNVTVCVDKYLKDRPKKIFQDMKINFDTELVPLRYVVTVDHTKGGVESVRYDDKNGKFNLYITPTKSKNSFDFKNVTFSDGGTYDLIIVMGAKKLEHLGEVYTGNKEFFENTSIIGINNLVPKGFGKVSLTSCEIPVSEIVYNLVSDSFSTSSINQIIRLLLMGIVNELQLFNKSDFKISTVETMTSLIKVGADIKEVFRDIYFKKDKNIISVTREIMSNVKVDSENRVVWSKVDFENFSGSGAKKSDLVLDGFIPFNISDDFDIAFVIYEVGKGEIWIELESNIEGMNAKDVLSSFKSSGNDYRAVAAVKNNGVGQVESIILASIKTIKERPIEKTNKPNSKDILTKSGKPGHNDQVFSDQGLITPPPLSPTR
jgi:nanoRNase/pAp phosphatase (c-di-AMP/oligoRNAs hydrolase)